MEKLFNLEIISPENVIYKGEAASLVAPAELGYLGVLADHAPLIANIVKGRIIVRERSGERLIFYSQNKGFLQVLKNNVSLILDTNR